MINVPRLYKILFFDLQGLNTKGRHHFHNVLSKGSGKKNAQDAMEAHWEGHLVPQERLAGDEKP